MRPYLPAFLHYLFFSGHFKVAIWSSARPENVRMIVESLGLSMPEENKQQQQQLQCDSAVLSAHGYHSDGNSPVVEGFWCYPDSEVPLSVAPGKAVFKSSLVSLQPQYWPTPQQPVFDEISEPSLRPYRTEPWPSSVPPTRAANYERSLARPRQPPRYEPYPTVKSLNVTGLTASPSYNIEGALRPASEMNAIASTPASAAATAPPRRPQLLDVFTRADMGLSECDYNRNIQTVKDLRLLWERHPSFGAHNTVLIDDTLLKAVSARL